MKKLTKNVKKYILTILFGIVWVALLSSVLLLLNPNYKIEESKKYYVKAQTVYHHDYDLSEQYFKNSILLNPDFKKPYLMLFHYYYFVQVQPQKAKIIVEEFINKFPQDSIGYILRSFINIKNGNLIDAEKNLNHSISLMSNNDFNDITFLNQGVLDYYKGEYVNADIMFNKSLFTNNTFMVEETNLYFNSSSTQFLK